MLRINMNLDMHLGDRVLALSILNDVTKLNDVEFDIYGGDNPQLLELVEGCDKLHMHLENYTGVDPIYNTWCGNYKFSFEPFGRVGFENGIIEYFKYLFSNIINVPMNCDIGEFVISFDSVNNFRKLEHIGNIDYLFINSDACSGQLCNSSKDVIFTNQINTHAINGDVVWCTKRVNGLHPSVIVTTDYNYTLRDIAELSIYSKNIISVGTSPILCCMNIHNINKNIVIYENCNIHLWLGNSKNVRI